MFHDQPATAIAVAQAESGLKMIQSREIYQQTDTRRGIFAGNKEESFCIFQIHAPDHDASAKRLGYGDYKTNIESCVKMARVIYENRGHTFKDWSVYNNGQYLVYMR